MKNKPLLIAGISILAVLGLCFCIFVTVPLLAPRKPKSTATAPAPVAATAIPPETTPPPAPTAPPASPTPDSLAKARVEVDLLSDQIADLRIALKDNPGDFEAHKAALRPYVESVAATSARLKDWPGELSPDARRLVKETALDCGNAARTVMQGFDEGKPGLITQASLMFDNCDMGLGLAKIKLAME